MLQNAILDQALDFFVGHQVNLRPKRLLC